jgi:hypothetical protein
MGALSDMLRFSRLHGQLHNGRNVRFDNVTKKCSLTAVHDLSPRQVEVLLAGGLINWIKSRLEKGTAHV